jgi:hypothetical protein
MYAEQLPQYAHASWFLLSYPFPRAAVAQVTEIRGQYTMKWDVGILV